MDPQNDNGKPDPAAPGAGADPAAVAAPQTKPQGDPAPTNLIDALKPPAVDPAKPADPAAKLADPAKTGETLLAGKYKTPVDLEKGYKELETKLGQQAEKLKGFAGAPEKYDLTMPEALANEIEWRTDDPLLTKFQTLAREQGMSQQLFSGILGILAEYELSNVSPDWAKEKAAIGERADDRLKDFGDWYGANLDDEGAAAVKRALGVNPTPADIFVALELVMGANRQPAAVPPGDDIKGGLTIDDVDREWNAKNDKGERLVEIDPAYRDKVRAKRAKVVGSGDHKVVVGNRA